MPSDSPDGRTSSTRSKGAANDVDLLSLASDHVLAGKADVSTAREARRHKRVLRTLIVVALIECYFGYRVAMHSSLVGFPGMNALLTKYGVVLLLICGMCLLVAGPFIFGGRSPHRTYRASDIDVRLSDVRGAGSVMTEVVNTLNLFLGSKTFARDMGGSARRGVLFEGPPGTGKTFMAKAMAGESGVPFLFVNSSAFQSMYHGQTNRKIRAFFRALRNYARSEGGAIGFIEEIDAIGGARSGMRANRSDGIAGVVNELLIQMQSFDDPTKADRVRGFFTEVLNRWLPEGRQIAKRSSERANILVIAATNRKDDLDPALLRPGRFDRSITFDPPSRAGRADILSYYLAKKSHDTELGTDESVDRLAAMTMGYTPVMLERLLDEALVVALRRGAREMSWADIADAKLITELGQTAPVEYTELEKRTIATHEAGHCTVAYFVGQSRQLDVLSIKKRRVALGLLQHSDAEERFTTTKSEFSALVQIAMGGMAAEEQYFGEAGSGPSGDLAAATEMACAMVGAYGMGDNLISYYPASEGGNIVSKVLGSDHGRAEVERMLRDAKEKAAAFLDEHAVVVEALRDALLERDELVGSDITDVIEAALANGADTAPLAAIARIV